MIYPKFKKFIMNNSVIDKGESVVLGVSGGVDSMVLLDLFKRLQHTIKFEIIVAHVNYGLRGRASNADEKLVRAACESHGVALEVFARKPTAGKNVQDEARKIRRDFFKRIADRVGAAGIATAHHMNDQAETVLLHLIRGAGLQGLSGMESIVYMDNMRILKPLLGVSREEILRYASKRNVRYNDDATNAKTKYLRNSVRLKLIPALMELNPRIVATLAKTAERLSWDEHALKIVSRECMNEAVIKIEENRVTLSGRLYSQFPHGVRMRIMQMAFHELTASKKDLSCDHLARMDHIANSSKQAGSYRLPNRCKFEREGENMAIFKSKTTHDR